MSAQDKPPLPGPTESRPVPVKRDAEIIFDIEQDFIALYKAVREQTMNSFENLYNLYSSINYVIDADIPGAAVECGVWRGGCMMLTAMQLLRRDVKSRELWLYDTFEGMTKPDERDFKFVMSEDGKVVPRFATPTWETEQRDGGNDWCFASIDDVRQNMATTGYPADRIRYVKGDVTQTLIESVPEQISLLRLDTDWYESSRAELETLWPRLSVGGVLIIDDYGGWRGQRQAVDEFFAEHGSIMLHRVSRNCRSGVKCR